MLCIRTLPKAFEVRLVESKSKGISRLSIIVIIILLL